MANKYYNRKYLRKYFATGIYVSSDGEYAEKDIKLKTGENKVLKYNICKDECGRAYIYDSYLTQRLYLDFLTLTCFRCQAPQDGKTYYPFHKDGDMRNSAISNLEWREETPETIAEYEKLEKESWYKNRKIRATRKGVIKQGAHDLPFIHYFYDSDLDWTYHMSQPWVMYDEKNRWGKTERHQISANKVFEDFGLVNGDKSKFTTPVILHLNNDYLDYRTENLEWCDASDQRYRKFVKIRNDAVMQKDHDCNYRLTPSEWDLIYQGKEPYQDWTDRPDKKLYKFH
ncbi:MAG: hypothetical protein HDR38_05810 [Treponema sp.]|nr:hypothetical protein [Treponema sp.]